jgi:hypothetical protein
LHLRVFKLLTSNHFLHLIVGVKEMPMLLFVPFTTERFLPWRGTVSYPCIKPSLFKGGSILEGIKMGLMTYVLVCTYIASTYATYFSIPWSVL